ncbi:MAG: hypothetical protein KBD07_03030 [Candidatus Omnitrophica bacterium]|jgi:hypothetical protein|nr:hypothetical protein [Candidatus Omnitrophota bacterium]
MKKSLISLPMAAALILLAVSAHAAGSVTVPFTATVQSVLELGVEIREFKDGVVTNWGATSMNFGTLKSDSANGPMRGEFYFDVYLHPNSSSRPYRLTQSANILTNGNQTIPAGACMVTPWPTDKNGAAYPAGATIGTAGSFIGTNKIIYQSEPAGSYVPVAFTYAITNDAATGATGFVPFDQSGGSYSSSITFQIVLT